MRRREKKEEEEEVEEKEGKLNVCVKKIDFQ